MLIVVGGRTDSVEILELSNPAAKWTRASTPAFANGGLRGVTVDNIFYVTGKT